jgi:hypothetical protein
MKGFWSIGRETQETLQTQGCKDWENTKET